MKLRALSDRMNADKATASSRSVFHQHAERAVTSSRSSMTSCRSSTYQNGDRVATSSRSALGQNADRVHASSKSAQQASRRSLREPHGAVSLPRAAVNKGSHVSHVALSNSITQKFVTSHPKHSVMPNSSQSASTLHTTQVGFPSKLSLNFSFEHMYIFVFFTRFRILNCLSKLLRCSINKYNFDHLLLCIDDNIHLFKVSGS